MTSTPNGGKEYYPGRSFSISQLLYATKRKIQGITSGRRVTSTTNRAEVDTLEETALEVLSLIRCMKNAFALINKTSPDILSLVPEYWNHRQRDKEIIKLTHVCHGWRELFTSRPSLWNRLDCVDVNKTHTYLERSKFSPLEISLKKDNEKPIISYRNDALVQLVPHIDRVKSLTVTGLMEDVLPDITTHFSCPVPLLEKLSIIIRCLHAPILDPALFNRASRCCELWSSKESLAYPGTICQTLRPSPLTAFRRAGSPSPRSLTSSRALLSSAKSR